MPSPPRIYEFADFVLDEASGKLRQGVREVTLTPKAYETLAYLLHRAGQLVSKQELLDAVWPGVSVEENNLEQQIFQLRKILGKTSIETAARRGYRFEATVRTVPVAGPRADGSAPDRGRVVWLLAGALAAAAVVVAMGLRWEARRPPLARIHSLAVLPFQPIAGDGDGSEALGLGLADAVITRLGGLHGISLRPTLAVSRFGGGAVDPATAGRALQVDAVLQTTLQSDGDQVRVRAQLVDVRADATVWTAQFDVAAGEMFQLEDAVSTQLASHLGAELGVTAQSRRPVDRAVYAAYLQGRWHWSRRTARDLAEAERLFGEALARDPAYAPAQAGLSQALLTQGRHAEARAAAEKALALDQDLAEPHAVLGFLAFFEDRDALQAQTELARAVELNASHATAYQWLAFIHVARRHCGRARSAIARARELDPASSTINTDLAHIDYYCGDFAAAEREIRTALRLDPGFAQAYSVLAAVLREQGRYDEARQTYESMSKVTGGTSPLALAELEARAGHLDVARSEFEQFERAGERPPSADVARILALLERTDEAVAELERCAAAKESNLMLVAVDPAAAALRADPRAQALIKRLGLG